ncbi:MAG: hypothetical protein RQ760_17795 [Sedimentisphaerales bacterium]|nr:hypothetical protein [Sedimentisphaerales bacterium]
MHTAPEPLDGAEVPGPVPFQPSILTIEGEPGPHTEINGKQRSHGNPSFEDTIPPIC